MDEVPTYATFPADRWSVLRPLGEGAQSHSMLARNVQTEELVSLKRLHARHVTDLKQLELFFREGAVLRTLDHPGIPRVLDTFLVREGDAPAELYIAQTFFEGRDLRACLADGLRPSTDDVVRWLKELLEILGYLHTRVPPVFHRDIKPSNIMLNTDGRIALVDFGAVASGFSTDTATTIVGTPGFSAPEQFSGIANRRTDLYALGAVAWHILTGRTPMVDATTGRLPIPDELPFGLAAFIAATTHPIPAERPLDAQTALTLLETEAPPTPPAKKPEVQNAVDVAAPPGWESPLPPAPRDPRGPGRKLLERLVRLDAQDHDNYIYLAFILALATFVLIVLQGTATGDDSKAGLAALGTGAMAVVAVAARWHGVEKRLALYMKEPTRSPRGRLFVHGTVLPARIIERRDETNLEGSVKRVLVTLAYERGRGRRRGQREVVLTPAEGAGVAMGDVLPILIDPDDPQHYYVFVPGRPF